MRKILNIMAIALAIFCRIPVEVHGQSFLKKLKQKVGNVVGTKDDTAEIGEEPFVGGDGDQPTRSVTPTDKLQKRRTATATWDEMIAPSFPRCLPSRASSTRRKPPVRPTTARS